MKELIAMDIVELYIERCEHSLVVDRKNIELTIFTYYWDPYEGGLMYPSLEEDKVMEEYITFVQQELAKSDKVKFVCKEDEFEFEGRKFTARANYIINKKYNTYLEALLAEIEGR